MSALRLVTRPEPQPPIVSVVDDGMSLKERWALEDRGELLSVLVERRYRKKGGGHWRGHEVRDASGRWKYLDLAVPSLADGRSWLPGVPRWTPDLLSEAIALIRTELRARGAKGACRITVTSHDTSAWNCVQVAVRVGVLRATFDVDGGTIQHALPREVLSALGDHAAAMTEEVRGAVKHARQDDSETGGSDGDKGNTNRPL